MRIGFRYRGGVAGFGDEFCKIGSALARASIVNPEVQRRMPEGWKSLFPGARSFSIVNDCGSIP